MSIPVIHVAVGTSRRLPSTLRAVEVGDMYNQAVITLELLEPQDIVWSLSQCDHTEVPVQLGPG